MDQSQAASSAAKATHPMILVAAGAVTIASLAAAAHFTGLLPATNTPAPVVASAPVTAPVPAEPAPAAAAATTPAATPAEPAPQAAAPAVEAPAPQPHKPVTKASKPASTHATTSHRNVGPADRRYEEASTGNTRRVSANGSNDSGIDVYPANGSATASGSQPHQTSVPPQAICHECGTVESVREVASEGSGGVLGAVAGGVLGGVLGHQVGRGSGKDLATIAGAVGGAFAGHQVEKNVRSDKQYQVTVRFDDGVVRTYTLSSAQWRSGDRVRSNNGQLGPI